MLALLSDPTAWAALVTLTALEIVLGIDNVVFISIVVNKLPDQQRRRARAIGLFLALAFRVALLFSLTWLIHLRNPVITLWDTELSWNDIILIGGGLFLIAKATHEIHGEIEGEPGEAAGPAAVKSAFLAVIAQIIVIDLVFSIDSIITAIGMAQDIEIMITAVILAVAVMYAASGQVAGFIVAHPTTKMLALAFLLLIGVSLVADGVGYHIELSLIHISEPTRPY